MFWYFIWVKKQILRSPRHCSKIWPRSIFTDISHIMALGINREACCAPRMHVCRVPISEYTVIGLPEGLCLTFRLQVAGHSTAHPSCISAINPFLTHSSGRNRKVKKSDKLTTSEEYMRWFSRSKINFEFYFKGNNRVWTVLLKKDHYYHHTKPNWL